MKKYFYITSVAIFISLFLSFGFAKNTQADTDNIICAYTVSAYCGNGPEQEYEMNFIRNCMQIASPCWNDDRWWNYRDSWYHAWIGCQDHGFGHFGMDGSDIGTYLDLVHNCDYAVINGFGYPRDNSHTIYVYKTCKCDPSDGYSNGVNYPDSCGVWECWGTGGPPTPIDAVCGATHYNCAAGQLGATAEYPDAANPNLYEYQWWCLGTGGGINAPLCHEAKSGHLPCPSNFKVSCAGTQATISWDALSGASGYVLRANKDPYSDWFGAGDIWKEPASPSQILDITSGVNYNYDVQGKKPGEAYPYAGDRCPFDIFNCPTCTPTCTSWSNWFWGSVDGDSACSAACGPGQQTRHCLASICGSVPDQWQVCNNGACPPPVCGSLPVGRTWCPGDGITASFDGELNSVSDSSNCSSGKCEYYQNPIPGNCGSADGGIYCQQPTGTKACSHGNVINMTNDGKNWTWTCQGLYEGDPDFCSATKSCAYREVVPN